MLSAANPASVMLRVSGYGQTGPYRRRSGFAHIAHVFGGLSYPAGFPGETPVVPGTAPLADYMSSLYGAIGIMLALRHAKDRVGARSLTLPSMKPCFVSWTRSRAPMDCLAKSEDARAGSFVAVPHGHFSRRDERWRLPERQQDVRTTG